MTCWQGYLYPRGLQIPGTLWPRNAEFSLIIQTHSSKHRQLRGRSLGDTDKLHCFQLCVFQSLKLNQKSVFPKFAKFPFNEEVDMSLVEKVVLRRQHQIFPISISWKPLYLYLLNNKKILYVLLFRTILQIALTKG